MKIEKAKYFLSFMIGVGLFCTAIYVIHRELHTYHYHDIIHQFGKLSARHFVTAFLLMISNYLVLSGYDFLAFRYIQQRLSYFKIAIASFIGYAFSYNLGFPVLTGGSVRYRLYSSWGLSTIEITQLLAFNSLTFWLGFLALSGIFLMLQPLPLPPSLHVSPVLLSVLGALFAVVVPLIFVASFVRQRPIMVYNWEFPVPGPSLLLSQIAISSLDWVLSGSVLYALFPDDSAVSFSHFMSVYLLAQILGVVSHVPGGLGVFESVLILFLPPHIATPAILGSLLAYRVIYYFLPLLVATLMLGAHELFQRKKEVRHVVEFWSSWATPIIPYVFSFTTFICGSILLFSGATPTLGHRLMWLRDFMPLPIMEFSHFAGSVVGAGLLVLARGLQRRIDATYYLTIVLLIFGIVLSILKGLDYEEAIILAIMLAALIPCRKHFYRKASLLSEPFSFGWTIAIVAVLLSSVWLGIFSHKHVEYSTELFWKFEFYGNASRFIRASMGAFSLSIVFGSIALLRSARRFTPSQPFDFGKVKKIIRTSHSTTANLALLGDKSFFFSDSGDAFIMYAVEGKSWISMGDPVGPMHEYSELVWRFRALCDRHSAHPVFYQVDTDHLPLYIDLGLTLLKLGEEAFVDLESFNLDGKEGKNLRHTNGKISKEGYGFSIIPTEGFSEIAPRLREISDEWLRNKNTREKRFSLGCFRMDYLSNFPTVIIHKDTNIVAFANLLTTDTREELSIDLMRHTEHAPPGVMDFLFSQLLFWGKAEGYRWFNFGMAPMSGFTEHLRAPLWNKLGGLLYRHGELFYNFQGLRQYKEKFHPVWRPKYLACPGGLALPAILTNLISLISQGIKGAVTK